MGSGGMTTMLEGLFMRRQNSFKSIFSGGRRRAGAGYGDDDGGDEVPISDLSPIANSVVSRCARILNLSTKELLQNFETELSDYVKQPFVYARHLVECCSYKALQVVTKLPDHLADKEFRVLTYDMMLAWENPGIGGNESLSKAEKYYNHHEPDDVDDASLFYTNSTSMAVQVDDKKTVGVEAFAQIACVCPIIADPISVHNLFDALTSSSGGQLHFLVYDKYLKGLEKILKSAKNTMGQPLTSSLPLADGEIILDVDGVMPTHPVLQHIGISAWPGRLTLTSHALYFESLGVASYDKATTYNLATDLKQVIKRELIGPLGTRLFDKAVMYKSVSQAEPIYLEFPEFKGHSRRDYWLAITREVLNVHRFIRKFSLKESQHGEALAMAILGIFRSRALKEGFYITPSQLKTTLPFDLAENLPKGDIILQALHKHLELLHTGCQQHHPETSSSDKKSGPVLSPVSLYMLKRMGFIPLTKETLTEERDNFLCDKMIGANSALEKAVKESICDSGMAEAARATVDQVKVEGIDTNIAVMQALVLPLMESAEQLRSLAEWEDAFKSSVFLVLNLYVFYRGWTIYIFPCILLSLAILMLWNKFRRTRQPLEAFVVTPPPSKNAVEQILALQEAIFQLESYAQSGNVVLLKIRALLLAANPQATGKVALYLVAAAAVCAFVPFKHLLFLAFLEGFTRKMPLRKESTEKCVRRMREWWIRIPAAPVQLARPEENKKRK